MFQKEQGKRTFDHIPEEEANIEQIQIIKEEEEIIKEQINLEEEGDKIRGYRIVTPVTTNGRRHRDVVEDYRRIGKYMKNLLTFEVRMLDQPSALDLAVIEAIIEGKKNLLIKLEGEEEWIGTTRYFIPKEKAAMILRKVNDKVIQMYEGFTTWTKEDEDYWLATKDWPWSQEKEEGEIKKLAQIAKEKLKRELQWKKKMNRSRTRDEEDEDYENRWAYNSEAWNEELWKRWKEAIMEKEKEVEDERIVFEFVVRENF